MTLSYHISPDEGLITINGGGDVRLGDLAGLGRALLHDDAYDPSLPQLLDFRGLRVIRADPLDELRTFVESTYRPQVTGSVAVVIDDHLEHCHAADIYLLTCAISDAELFSDYDQALKWLMRREFVGQPSPQQDNAGGDEAYGSPE